MAMKETDGDWRESDLFCTCCGQVVTHRRWDNGFVVLRCQCIKKAGHQEVVPAEGWIDKRCQGDELATSLELMHVQSNTYFD